MRTLPRLCLLFCSLMLAVAANAAKDPDTLVVRAKTLRLYAAHKPDSLLGRRAKRDERFVIRQADSLQYVLEFPDGAVARVTKDTALVAILPGAPKPEPPLPPAPAEPQDDPVPLKVYLALAAGIGSILGSLLTVWLLTRPKRHLFDEPKKPKAR